MSPQINKVKMNRRNFHTTSYGWNYFAEKAGNGKIRVGRYYTNGWANSNENKSNWFEGQLPETQQECERLVEEKFYKESRH